MSAGFLGAMLLLGLASGVHCVGMCGGFVAAFSTLKGIPIKGQRTSLSRIALFNAGRITTYAALGAASGFVGGKVALALGAQAALYVLGTLPWLLVGGVAFQFVKKPMTRGFVGAGVLAFGVYGLAHASGAAQGLRGWLCP